MKKYLLPIVIGLVAVLSACSTSPTSNLPTEATPITEAEQLDAQLELTSAIVEDSLVIEEGDEVTVDLYQDDPEAEGVLLGSDMFVKGEESLRDVVKSLKQQFPDADYLMVSANGQSRTVSLADARKHIKKRAAAAILGDLEDGTEVSLAVYNGQPDETSEAVASSTYIVGESTFRAALKALVASTDDNDISHLIITVGEESVTMPLPKVLTSDLGKFLAGLEQGTEVTVTLYKGDPADGGEELVNATFEIGEGYLKATLKSLRRNLGRGSHTHMTVSANGESITVELGKETKRNESKAITQNIS